MESALRTRARVLPGHRIEVIAPELAVGQNVEIFVVVSPPKKELSFLSLLEKTPSPGLFESPEEVDRFLDGSEVHGSVEPSIRVSGLY